MKIVLGTTLIAWAAITNSYATERPNVVIVLADDLGTLDANCYGSDDLQTPAIDRLAASGIRFTQAYAHTVCCPARAALLTGRHPQRSGVNTWTQGNLHSRSGVNMALEEFTLAEALSSAGYETALFGKWHLGAHQDYGPTKQGFKTFFGHRGGFIDNYRHFFLHGRGYHDLYEGTEEIQAPGQYFPEMVAARADKFLEENRSRPFFLYLALNIPHYPEQALQQFEHLYRDLPMPRRSFAAMVSTTDFYLGRVLTKLETLGLDQNTIILFMSDNGHSAEHKTITVDDHHSGLPMGHYYSAHGGGGNTGKWIGHKGTFLEGGIRVPAIMRFPGKPPSGEVRDQAVTAMDWYPTILECCGLELPDTQLDGKSLVPVLRSANAPSPHPTLFFQWHKSWAVRQGDWKLISGKQLVNLTDDEPEVKNYARERPEILQQLQTRYDAWQQEIQGDANEVNDSSPIGPVSQP